jgi:hypothetical protein
MRPQDMTPDQQTAFRLLPQQDLNVARASLLKERFDAFWDYPLPRGRREVRRPLVLACPTQSAPAHGGRGQVDQTNSKTYSRT